MIQPTCNRREPRRRKEHCKNPNAAGQAVWVNLRGGAGSLERYAPEGPKAGSSVGHVSRHIKLGQRTLVSIARGIPEPLEQTLRDTPLAALINRGRCAAVAACRRSVVSIHPTRADRTSSAAFSGLVREELERLVDELLVVLEDSAVAGVRVDHQLVVGQTSGHVEGVRRRQHPVVVAVGEEHGLADA
jgi:hypothetical protein